MIDFVKLSFCRGIFNWLLGVLKCPLAHPCLKVNKEKSIRNIRTAFSQTPSNEILTVFKSTTNKVPTIITLIETFTLLKASPY